MNLFDPRRASADDAASAPALSDGTNDNGQPAGSPPPTPHTWVARHPTRLDVAPTERYELRHVLGIGGMGRVHLAWDRRLDREIALKEVARQRIQMGFDQARPLSETTLTLLEARLEREARVTARLEHPGIVPVYDAGRSASGELFYAMRVIRGQSLADALKRTQNLDERIRLLRHVRDACEAVAWAHRHGVVHRDLKPANIMVGEFGETQVVDWGLARLLREDDAEPAHDASDSVDHPDAQALTMAGSMVGTPQYLSPEQVAGQPATPRSDVWSLGLVLYEVLVGRRAYAETTPSRVLAQVLAGPPPPPSTLEPRIPPELAAIVRRATAARDADRYPDAKALADDLTAWLEGRRVVAHTYTTGELFRRLVRAWRVPLLVAGIAFIALATVIAFAFFETDAARVRAENERERAEAESVRATHAESGARSALARADRALSRLMLTEATTRLRADAAPEAELLAAQVLSYQHDDPDARGILATIGAMPRPRHAARLALPGCTETVLASDATTALCRYPDHTSAWSVDPAGGPPTRLWTRRGAVESLFMLERARLAGLVRLDGITLVDLQSGRDRQLVPNTYMHRFVRASPRGNAFFGVANRTALHHDDGSLALDFDVCHDPSTEGLTTADDSGRVVVVCAIPAAAGTTGRTDGPLLRHAVIHIASPGDDYETFLLDAQAIGDPGGHSPPSADWAPSAMRLIDDGRTLIVASQSGLIAVVDVTTHRTLRTLSTSGARIIDLDVAANHSVAAIRDEQGGVRLWSPQTGEWLGRLPGPPPRGMRFLATHPHRLAVWNHDPDGRAGEHTLDLWDIAPSRPFRAHLPGGITSAFHDGHHFVASGTGFVRVWDGDMNLVGDHGFKRVVKDVAADPLGFQVAVTAMDIDGVQTLSLPDLGPANRIDTVHTHRRLAWLDRDVIAIAPFAGGLLLWPPPGPAWFHIETFNILDINGPPGAAFAAIARHDHPGLWRLAIHPAPTLHEVAAVNCNATDITRDGETLACLGRHEVTLHAPDGSLVAMFPADPRAPLTSVALSPAGDFVAAGNIEGALYLWSRTDGRLRARFHNHQERISAIVFLGEPNDGPTHTVITGSWDRRLRWHDLRQLDTAPDVLVNAAEQQWRLDVDRLIAREPH